MLVGPLGGAHCLGVVVSMAPTAVEASFDVDVETVFVPLAPNPVTGGFVVHAPTSRVRDLDLTVEEGTSAITSIGATERDAGGGVSGMRRTD